MKAVKYAPVLKALQAEFEALRNMKTQEADKVVPLFEVPKLTDSIRTKKRYEDRQEVITADYLDDVSTGVASAWEGRTAMLDTYHWAPDAKVESGEHVIPYIYTNLELRGVTVIPVVGYDRWEIEEYRLAVKSLRSKYDGLHCLRLDYHAFEDAAEPDFFHENINQILIDLELDPNDCHLLLDLADITTASIEQLFSRVELLVEQLLPYGFNSYSICGCSLPKTIDAAVNKPDTCGNIVRKEMLLWRHLRQQYSDLHITFGDYGIRGPNTNEGIRNKHTNGKIRHTIDKEYFVARGHSMSLPGKGEQMWGLAKTIVESKHYMGEEFSWGDKQIFDCSNGAFKGNAALWISIDTNHHLAYVVAEVEEFESRLAATKMFRKSDA